MPQMKPPFPWWRVVSWAIDWLLFFFLIPIMLSWPSPFGLVAAGAFIVELAIVTWFTGKMLYYWWQI
jgi:hypothetical protein